MTHPQAEPRLIQIAIGVWLAVRGAAGPGGTPEDRDEDTLVANAVSFGRSWGATAEECRAVLHMTFLDLLRDHGPGQTPGV